MKAKIRSVRVAGLFSLLEVELLLEPEGITEDDILMLEDIAENGTYIIIQPESKE